MDYFEIGLLVVFLIGISLMVIKRVRTLYYFAFFLIISVALFIYRLFSYDSAWNAFSESFGLVTIILGVAGIVAWSQHKKNARHSS